jgi:hypothetical protein
VAETRKIHGLPAAREMWFQLGLPTTPSMFVKRQGDLDLKVVGGTDVER